MKKYIMDEASVTQKLKRLALEVLEDNLNNEEIIFIGIAPQGPVIAKALMHHIKKINAIKMELVTLYMDKDNPKEIKLDKPIEFNNKTIVLVDDVTNTGRVLLYALKPLLEYQPKEIFNLVLVERTHKKYPIAANYKGLSIATTLQEHIKVETNGDKITGAYLI